jgi:uncharacterized membrane protein
MKYEELLAKLEKLSEENLGRDVTIYDSETDEFYPVNDLSFTVGGADVLDDDHAILIFKKNT